MHHVKMLRSGTKVLSALRGNLTSLPGLSHIFNFFSFCSKLPHSLGGFSVLVRVKCQCNGVVTHEYAPFVSEDDNFCFVQVRFSVCR